MKITAIVKRPGEKYGHMTYVSDKLEDLQRTVGGYIETVYLPHQVVVICNEEGKMMGLEKNLKIRGYELVGTLIVCGVYGENFGHIPISLGEWHTIVDRLEEE